MKCTQIQKRLSAYQDGELGEEEKGRIKEHLQDCVVCREQYKGLKQAWVSLGEFQEIQPSPGFYVQVQRRIARSNDYRFFPWLRQFLQFVPSPLVMTCLTMAGLVIGGFLGDIFFREDLISLGRYQSNISHGNVSLASMKTFDSIPPGTLAHGYIRLASYGGEGHR